MGRAGAVKVTLHDDRTLGHHTVRSQARLPAIIWGSGENHFSQRKSGQACPFRVGSHLSRYIGVLLNPQTLERRIPGIGVKTGLELSK